MDICLKEENPLAQGNVDFRKVFAEVNGSEHISSLGEMVVETSDGNSSKNGIKKVEKDDKALKEDNDKMSQDLSSLEVLEQKSETEIRKSAPFATNKDVRHQAYQHIRDYEADKRRLADSIEIRRQEQAKTLEEKKRQRLRSREAAMEEKRQKERLRHVQEVKDRQQQHHQASLHLRSHQDDVKRLDGYINNIREQQTMTLQEKIRIRQKMMKKLQDQHTNSICNGKTLDDGNADGCLNEGSSPCFDSWTETEDKELVSMATDMPRSDRWTETEDTELVSMAKDMPRSDGWTETDDRELVSKATE
ncbi:predicted protein [Nematostella vectensis]|uniref:Uncharacterized protein n=1 Tax=Nematostella vectensis TaxID=45351 RepID=A7RMX4_NEMVE|nr:predicted protein [Nematostella vectensis]|eukprot:XP_001639238.1 predicted protein [Nematostella vectensis]